jgi:hypothetical protein
MMTREPQDQRFDRTEKLLMAVVASIVAALFGIYLTLFLFHGQTHQEIAAENCVTAKCESPAVKAIINQAISGLTVAVQKNDIGDRLLLCTSLQELNSSSPSHAALTALDRYCGTSAKS